MLYSKGKNTESVMFAGNNSKRKSTRTTIGLEGSLEDSG